MSPRDRQPDGQIDGRVVGRAEGRIWTVEAVRQLGMTTDLATAAEILGIGRTLAFDLVRADRFPVKPLRLGRRVVVPVPELLRLLGVQEAPTPSSLASAPPTP